MNLPLLAWIPAALAGAGSMWLGLWWWRECLVAFPDRPVLAACMVAAGVAAWAGGAALANGTGPGDAGDRRDLGAAATRLALAGLAALAAPHVLALTDEVPAASQPAGIAAAVAVAVAFALWGAALPRLVGLATGEPAARPARAGVLIAASLGAAGGAALGLDAFASALGIVGWASAAMVVAGVGCRVLAALAVTSPPAAVAMLSTRPQGEGIGVRVLVSLGWLVVGAGWVGGELALGPLAPSAGGVTMTGMAGAAVVGWLGLALGFSTVAIVWPRARTGARRPAASGPDAAGGPVPLMGAGVLLAVAAFALVGAPGGSDTGPALLRVPGPSRFALGLAAGAAMAWLASRSPGGGPAPVGRWLGLAGAGGVAGLVWLGPSTVEAASATGVAVHAASVVAAEGLTLVAMILAATGLVLVVAARPGAAAGSASRVARFGAGVVGVAALLATLAWPPTPREPAIPRDRARAPSADPFLAPALARRLGRVSAALAPDARRAWLSGPASPDLRAGLESTSEAALTVAPMAVPDGEWDLIVVAPAAPWRAGAGARVSREAFRSLRRRLADSGVIVQWVALDQLPWPAFGTLAMAFLDAFPDGRLMLATPLSDAPLVALVGGRARLPDPGRVGELLADHPSADGLDDSGELLGLHVADAWTLRERFADALPCTREHPWPELRSQHSAGDGSFTARTALRGLAELVRPVQPASLLGDPLRTSEQRDLGEELVRRAASLSYLLRARAHRSELAGTEDLPAPDVDGWRTPREREAIADALDVELGAAWRSLPGAAAATAALLERAADLQGAGEFARAGTLIEAALAFAPDAVLAGAYGGLLLIIGWDAQAVAVLDAARRAAPTNRTVAVNLGHALARTGDDDRALEVLRDARALFGDEPLPPLPRVVLGLLERDPVAVDAARQLLERMDAGEPWAPTFRRLLDRSGSGDGSG